MSTLHIKDAFYLLLHVTHDNISTLEIGRLGLQEYSDLSSVQQLVSREFKLETDLETLFCIYSLTDENSLCRKGCSPKGIWEWVSCIFPASRELRNSLSKADFCMRLKIPVVVFIRKTKCLENTNEEPSPMNVLQWFHEDSLGTVWVHMSEYLHK